MKIGPIEIAVSFRCHHITIVLSSSDDETREHHRRASEILCPICELARLEEHRHHHHHHNPAGRTASIAVCFGEKHMNTLILLVGQSSTGTVVPLEADGVTQTPGAVVSNQSWSITDPSLTATTNADGSVTIEGVVANDSPVSGTVNATVTDEDGTVNSFSATFTVSVGTATPPPPPTGRTASIGVNFTTPA